MWCCYWFGLEDEVEEFVGVVVFDNVGCKRRYKEGFKNGIMDIGNS